MSFNVVSPAQYPVSARNSQASAHARPQQANQPQFGGWGDTARDLWQKLTRPIEVPELPELCPPAGRGWGKNVTVFAACGPRKDIAYQEGIHFMLNGLEGLERKMKITPSLGIALNSILNRGYEAPRPGTSMMELKLERIYPQASPSRVSDNFFPKKGGPEKIFLGIWADHEHPNRTFESSISHIKWELEDHYGLQKENANLLLQPRSGEEIVQAVTQWLPERLKANPGAEVLIAIYTHNHPGETIGPHTQSLDNGQVLGITKGRWQQDISNATKDASQVVAMFLGCRSGLFL